MRSVDFYVPFRMNAFLVTMSILPQWGPNGTSGRRNPFLGEHTLQSTWQAHHSPSNGSKQQSDINWEGSDV